jgi:hypothetical protein
MQTPSINAAAPIDMVVTIENLQFGRFLNSLTYLYETATIPFVESDFCILLL